MSDTLDLEVLQSLLDSALETKIEEEEKVVEEKTEPEMTEEDMVIDEDWKPHPDFEGVETRVVDAAKLFRTKKLKGLTVQTYRGFEDVCSIPVPPIPAVYVPNIDQIRSLIISANTKLKTLHIGHTGSGKTSGIEYFAAMTGRPFHRQECDAFTDDQKLFGSLELHDGKTYFNKSDLTKSVSWPAITCLDESNALPSTTQMALNPLLDRRQVRVTSYDDTCETIEAHDEWMVACTSNTNGSADDLDLYNSANVQDQAMINRLDLFVNVPYPSESIERKIISKLAPAMEDMEVKRLAKFSKLCHKAFEDRELSTAFSIRNLVAITQLLDQGLHIKEAININYTNRVSKADQSYVNTQLVAIW